MKNFPLRFIGWLIFVLVASFQSWGAFQPTSMNIGPFGDIQNFPGLPISLTLTGWHGTVTVARIELPNALVVMAGIAAAVVGILIDAGVTTVKRSVGVALAAYGLVQILLTIVLLMFSGRHAAVGVGALLTAFALVCIAVSLLKARPVVQSAAA